MYKLKKLLPRAKPVEDNLYDEPVVYKSDLAVLDRVVIIVPQKIVDICTALQRKFEHHEFSILAKGDWTSQGFELSEEYAVPKQTVEYASVEYDREDLARLKQIGYNTVVHAHPYSQINANRKNHTSCFSTDDEATINNHFKCSVLYCGGTLDDARVTIELVPGLTLKLAAHEIAIHRPDIELPPGTDIPIKKVPEIIRLAGENTHASEECDVMLNNALSGCRW